MSPNQNAYAYLERVSEKVFTHQLFLPKPFQYLSLADGSIYTPGFLIDWAKKGFALERAFDWGFVGQINVPKKCNSIGKKNSILNWNDAKIN